MHKYIYMHKYMFLFMYTLPHILIHKHTSYMYTYIHTYICRNKHTCTYIYKHIHMHTDIRTCISHTHIHMHTDMHTCTLNTHTYTCIYIDIQKIIFIDTHIQKFRCRRSDAQPSSTPNQSRVVIDTRQVTRGRHGVDERGGRGADRLKTGRGFEAGVLFPIQNSLSKLSNDIYLVQCS